MGFGPGEEHRHRAPGGPTRQEPWLLPDKGLLPRPGGRASVCWGRQGMDGQPAQSYDGFTGQSLDDRADSRRRQGFLSGVGEEHDRHGDQ